MARAKLTIGTRVYYTGDIANDDGFGVVTEIMPATKYGPEVAVMHLDDGRELSTYAMSIEAIYNGHCGTKFVTEAAYKVYREAKLAELQTIMTKISR